MVTTFSGAEASLVKAMLAHCTDSEIARAFGTSSRYIRHHLSSLRAKLGVPARAPVPALEVIKKLVKAGGYDEL